MKYVHQLQQQQQSLYRWNNKKLFLLILIAAIKFHSISSFLLAAATPTSTTTKRTTTMDEEEESAPTTTELYKPYRKYPELFGNTFKEEWLHPTMIQLVKEFKRHDLNETTSTDTSNDTKDEEFISRITVSSGSDTSLLLLKKEMEDVYSFDCFTEEFIRMFNEELHNFYHISEIHNIPVLRPNSMNNYGVIVNEIGMRELITNFQQEYLWPISKVLYPIHGSQFDYHHSFIVRYHTDEDLGLDMHVDDSDVTFNVCMGDFTEERGKEDKKEDQENRMDEGFTGATLVFCGMFGSSNHRHVHHSYNHKIGRAILHLGSRRHGAQDITSGTRTNLIIWNHNYQYRRSDDYVLRRGQDKYQAESSPPDLVCLSYTHDRDYTKYKQLPPNAHDPYFHGWCPPKGKEYPGYYDKDNTNKKKRPQSSQDEL